MSQLTGLELLGLVGDTLGICGFAWLIISTWLQSHRLNRDFRGARTPAAEIVLTIRREASVREKERTAGTASADNPLFPLVLVGLAALLIAPAYLSHRTSTLVVASVVVGLSTILIGIQVLATRAFRVIAGLPWQLGSWMTVISSAIGVATIVRLWVRDTPAGPYSEIQRAFASDGFRILFDDGGLLFFFLLYEVAALTVCLLNSGVTNLTVYTRALAARSTMEAKPPGWLVLRFGPRATWQLWLLPLLQVVLMIVVNVVVSGGFIEDLLDFELPTDSSSGN